MTLTNAVQPKSVVSLPSHTSPAVHSYMYHHAYDHVRNHNQHETWLFFWLLKNEWAENLCTAQRRVRTR